MKAGEEAESEQHTDDEVTSATRAGHEEEKLHGVNLFFDNCKPFSAYNSSEASSVQYKLM